MKIKIDNNNSGIMISPSSTSLDSGGGSFDRKKKKPLFQRMLEKAREEDRDHGKHKSEKPLFQRILEKAQIDSDREDKLRVRLLFHDLLLLLLSLSSLPYNYDLFVFSSLYFFV